MSSLLRAELLKLRTTRTAYGYLIVLVALSGIAAAAQASAGHAFELDDPAYQRDLVSQAIAAPLIALLLGIVLVTVEWRHGTITRTFLVTPRRERVIATKGIAAFLLGVVLAVLAVAVVLVVAAVVFSSDGGSLEVNGALAARIGEIVIAVALWGALGAGVGALVQNQTVALVGAIISIVVLEELLDALLGWAGYGGVADALPGRALGALDGSRQGGLSPAAGGAVGLGYVLLFTTLGWLRVRRQDIT
jgi:ABC-type transport system involved in multi-copper enzyme maturation permease subunit